MTSIWCGLMIIIHGRNRQLSIGNNEVASDHYLFIAQGISYHGGHESYLFKTAALN